MFGASLNDLGHVAISTQVNTPGLFNDHLVYVRRTDGSTHELARTGDATPTPGLFYETITAGPVPFNDLDQAAIRVTLVDGSDNFAGYGEYLVGVNVPDEQLTMSAVQLNNLGGIGGKVGTSVTGEQIVSKPNGGNWKILAQTGDSFGGDLISDLDSSTDYNDQGQVLFIGELTSTSAPSPPPPTDSLLLVDDDTSLTRIAAVGEVLPGLPAPIERFLQMDLNNNGQVTFAVQMDDANLGKALLLYDPSGGQTVPAYEGQSFEGDVITDLAFKGGTSFGNEYSGFNDAGEVAWEFRLDQAGYGVALYTNRQITPEPASLAWVGASTLALIQRRRNT